MGNDKYIVAYTSDTLLLGDLKTFRISEVRQMFQIPEKSLLRNSTF